ncbi:TonB-dependent receptor [Maribellus maritimus]|uniref:TonB-dependent receptor n=1 Tax=Maribellus maritimus TaxID=2870838 RepID=UPI001EEAA72A|nr:TonB-dependent receptor [Maribellus maritimus]MCG6187643.1 TonB-dependent receptor [Maribellus maritimus]
MKKCLKGKGLFYPVPLKLFLKMKLTFLVVLLVVFQSFAENSLAQGKISVEYRNVTIEKILSELENHFELGFMYNKDLVDVGRKVDINMENATIDEILSELFLNENVIFHRINNQIVISPEFSVIQQQKSISGKVTDFTGFPLPGVTVIIKGSTQGTTTDTEGKFTLNNIPNDAILQFSFVGMKTQEIVVSGKNSVNVILEEETVGLEEVIAIGYGIVKKTDLTGSVSSVKSELIEKQNVTRLDQAIQGRASGVLVTTSNGMPGATSSIRIRGGNSINAGNEPLYVIDGVIGGGDLNLINPNDIESIEILKDASSTAIYGARGANGVILVTTKRGKNGIPVVNVNTYYGIQTLPKRIDLLDGPEYYEYAIDYAKWNGGEIPYEQYDGLADTDWQDVGFETAGVYSADANISAGTEKSNYFLSIHHSDQRGIVIGSGLKKYQLRFNIDQKLGNTVKIGATLNFSRTNTDNNKVGVTALGKLLPTDPIYDEVGNYWSVNSVHGSIYDNPLAQNELKISQNLKNRALGNIYAQLDFNNELNFKTTLGFDINSDQRNRYEYSTLPTLVASEKGGNGSIYSAFPNTIQSDNVLNYIKSLSEVHKISAMLGLTYQHYEQESHTLSASGFTNDVTKYNSLESGDPLLRDIESDFTEWTIISGLARFNYTLKNKYLFTVTGRYDGSSRLGENNKYAFFPSAAFAWKVTNEPFFKNLDLFSTLKFRTSYGRTGNQGIGAYSTLSKLNAGTTIIGLNEVLTYVPGRIANPNLKWETTDQFDIGLDGGLKNNRVYFEADYYYKRTHDLLLNRDISNQTGYTSKLENIGEIENQGIEFMIKYQSVKKNDFSWDISANISKNWNKVIDLGGEEFIITKTSGGTTGLPIGKLMVGEPVGTFVGLKTLGTWKEGEIPEGSDISPGDIKVFDASENGTIDEIEDEVILGNAEPLFFGGIQTNFIYKNLTLSFFLQGSYGNSVYNLLNSSALYTGNSTNVVGKYRDRWTEENSDSNFPAAGAVLADRSYDYYVEDGSYLKVKSLNISYQLPFIKHSDLFKMLSVYFTGNNLLTITGYDGYDPDVNSEGTDSTLRGYDNNVYPQARTYIFGIKATF